MNTRRRSIPQLALAMTLAVAAAHAQGAATDLSNAPLVVSSSSAIPVMPNVFLMMDDSGSMGWDYMPDDVNNFSGNYGYASSQCNGVYYNPNITYAPPVDSTGASYSNSSFTSAWTNGYNTGSGSVNLSTSFSVSGFSSQPAFYYTYSGTQTTTKLKDYYNTSSTFYQECNSSIGSTPGSSVFTKVVVSSTSGPGGTDERTNFANWYSYYRTRILMMKTATGLAFKPLGTNYRVGFATMNNNGGSKFLNLAQFTSSQRAAWYNMLYSTSASNSTPLLGALANVGKVYANKISSLNGVSVTDPIQYSCQQNFTILSTDGFWNSQTGDTKLDGTQVGEQDGYEIRPMNDGLSSATASVATITVSNSNKTSVTSIKVNGVQILSRSTSSSGSDSSVASYIATNINKCTNSASGNCTSATGYTATANNNTVTVVAPVALGAITYTPAISFSGGGSVSSTAFSSSTVSTGGTSNTLSDVAEYYYVTDLRTSALGNATGVLGTDVSLNNVPTSGQDTASWQHMTTFTLGLGARGRMVFSPTYQTDTSGDFFDVKNGSTANSSSGICSWQATGTICNWPIPNPSGTPENIDDLWHAAVNGRGTYFSATDPSTLALALTTALAGVSARTGAAAAATTSNPNVTSGDNFVFSSTFVTQDWTGELIRQQLDLTTGATLPTIDWAAQAQLDALTYTSRNIYTFSSTATNKLTAFNATNFGSNANFNTPHIASLSQFCSSGALCLSAASQTAAAGSNLVNFLIGDRSNEGFPTDSTKYYRHRAHVLGDIVNAEAVYVKGTQFTYADAGYSGYTTAVASRQGMVYAASNDGMLHAFYAASDMMDANGNVVTSGGTNVTGGTEAWAYVPSFVLPNLYRLADINYANNHQYYVDGTPVQGDICVSGCGSASAVWKTILVGGLNGGGRGYYALDITNPAAPKALWEFTDTNMGYTYGNPQIAKLSNGNWVVLVTSGYNNTSPGDGMGHLYVLDAYNGTLLQNISTGVGSTTTPSGLSRIIAQVVNNISDATILQVYGGDVLGNLWRFDVNGNVGAAGYDAQLLATLYGSTGVAQPITAKPQVGIVSGNTVVYVGTGRYLGTSDLTNTDPESIYAIKDPLATNTTPSTAIYPNPRTFTPNGFVQQTITATTCPVGSPTTICSTGQVVYTATRNTVNFSTNSGWYVDLPGSGERATTDPTLKLGTLGFTTNIPSASSCTVGGTSFSYFFDYRTGAPVSTSTTGVLAVKLGNALATRPVYVRLPNNTVVQLIRLSDGTTMTTNVPIGSGAANTRRVSWRELMSQ